MARIKKEKPAPEEVVIEETPEEVVIEETPEDAGREKALLESAQKKLSEGMQVPQLTLLEQWALLRHEQRPS